LQNTFPQPLVLVLKLNTKNHTPQRNKETQKKHDVWGQFSWASRQDLDTLRKEAAQTLLKAAQNGTLQSVLSQKTGQERRHSGGTRSGLFLGVKPLLFWILIWTQLDWKTWG
jgi:hypothetical protein